MSKNLNHEPHDGPLDTKQILKTVSRLLARLDDDELLKDYAFAQLGNAISNIAMVMELNDRLKNNLDLQ
jgi:hypothetical protein